MSGIRQVAMLAILLALAANIAGCGQSPDAKTVSVSVIGGPPRLIDPNRAAPDRASAILLRETRQGLVAFDASGQIEPALAESWTFTKDGLSVIFRVRRLKWPGGADLTAADVAASLNAAMAPGSTNRLKPLLSAVESVVAMTDRVVEIRLRVPRPNLLELLAQPDLGITRRGAGTGPWEIAAGGRTVTLVPQRGEALLEGEEPVDPAISKIILRGERAAMAIARFREARGGFVTGGTAADWPVLRAAQLRSSLIRVDPAQGLFGLAATTARPFIKDDDMRKALSMAIDRNLLVASFEVPGWQPVDRLLPTQMDSAAPPATPRWTNDSLADRQSEARRRITAWTTARGALAPLKVALPDGAGMTILFARLRADWRPIGVPAVRVRWNDPDADLRLIDEVAPGRSANWYLTRTGCEARVPCSTEADFALKNARAAPDLPRRAAEIARADEAAMRWMAYIPLATPMRWSVVDPTMTGFRENGFAVRPFASLRTDGN
jgi:oligopeptide transport system substrate-binding protein